MAHYDELLLYPSLVIHSGGRSGECYSSDWMLALQPRCLPPEDPSFERLLGPMRPTGEVYEGLAEEVRLTGSYEVGVYLAVTCAEGYHLEPTAVDAEYNPACGRCVYDDAQP